MSNFCDNKSKFFSDLFSDNNKKVKRNTTTVCCAAVTKHHFTSLLSLKKNPFISWETKSRLLILNQFLILSGYLLSSQQ